MSNHVQTVGHRVAAQLFAAEAAVDAAMTEVSALVGLLPAARVESRVSAGLAQPAISASLASLKGLGEAREQIVEAHRQLGIAQRRVGLSETAYGAWIDKSGAPSASLKVVASKAA